MTNRRWLSWVWLIALVIWTALLWTPGSWFWDLSKVSPPRIIPLGKVLHVVSYFALAASAGWLPATRRTRHAILLGLVAHGAITEIGQLFVPDRDGTVRDFLIDSASTAGGWLLTRPWWPGDSGARSTGGAGMS
ncbi:MAG: VanZ family protein [Gemmataceae bacterium]|nr:VanZ family protein [Gemmataceae bacterium]